jgi:hypothetical protein
MFKKIYYYLMYRVSIKSFPDYKHLLQKKLGKDFMLTLYVMSMLKDMTLIVNVILPFSIKIQILVNIFLLIYRSGRRCKRSE